MVDVLLKELTSCDLDWLATVGQKQEFAAGEVVLTTDAVGHVMQLVLAGSLALLSAQQEVLLLASGDILGNFLLFNGDCLSFTAKAKEKTLLLAVPQQTLLARLNQDIPFSARFYHAMALLLARRQQQLTELGPPILVAQALFDTGMLSSFSCLQDSDLCWMTSKGRIERIASREIVIREGQPLDALRILLKGGMGLLACNQERRALIMAGAAPSPVAEQVAEVQPGEFLGVTQFLGSSPNPYTIRATADSLLLSLSLPVLEAKLQDDLEFAARFYRALASLTAERIQRILLRMQVNPSPAQMNEMNEQAELLCIEVLKQMSVARAKFNWLLKQLNIKD